MTRRGSFVDELNDAVRENPLAAGLIGLGAAWMLLGSNGMRGLAAPVPRLAKSAAGGVADAAKSAAGGMADMASYGVDKLRQGAAAASDAAGQAAAGIRDAMPSMPSIPQPQTAQQEYVPLDQYTGTVYEPRHSQWKRSFSNAQESAQRAFHQQPLLVGLAGIAVGAAVAAAFRTTELEQELVGEHASQLKQQVSETFEQAKDRATQALHAMQDEAAAQGLSVEELRDQAKTTTQRVSDTVKAGLRQ